MLRRFVLLAALAAFAPAAFAQTAEQAPAQPQQQLQPIEPQTALEHAFVAAFRSAAMRPAFRQQFMESNVLLVTTAPGPNAAPRFMPVPGGRTAMIFTSATLLERRLGPNTPHVAMTGRAALTRISADHVVINAGYEPMLVLDPPGIANFLGIPATPDSAGPSQ